jgi:hypothetical protein
MGDDGDDLPVPETMCMRGWSRQRIQANDRYLRLHRRRGGWEGAEPGDLQMSKFWCRGSNWLLPMPKTSSPTRANRLRGGDTRFYAKLRNQIFVFRHLHERSPPVMFPSLCPLKHAQMKVSIQVFLSDLLWRCSRNERGLPYIATIQTGKFVATRHVEIPLYVPDHDKTCGIDAPTPCCPGGILWRYLAWSMRTSLCFLHFLCKIHHTYADPNYYSLRF